MCVIFAWWQMLFSCTTLYLQGLRSWGCRNQGPLYRLKKHELSYIESLYKAMREKNGQRQKPIMKTIRKCKQLITIGKNIQLHCKQRNTQRSNISPSNEHFFNYNSQRCRGYEEPGPPRTQLARWKLVPGSPESKCKARSSPKMISAASYFFYKVPRCLFISSHHSEHKQSLNQMLIFEGVIFLGEKKNRLVAQNNILHFEWS